MEELFKGLPFSPIFYKGFTPDECKSYIDQKHPVHPEQDTTLCCLRSHISALKHFLEHSDKSMALMFEDDVLIRKDFVPQLQKVIELWKVHTSEIDFINIGYLPGNIQSKKNENELYWDLYCNGGSLWGCQAYLLKRSVVEDIVKCLDKPCVSQLNEAITMKIKENGGRIYSPKIVRAQADVVFSICWRQAFVKPMLVIESPLFHSSIIPTDSNSNTRGWNKAFQNGDLSVEDFAPCCELYLK
jgi:GR25 family glycosyltransferase involved in LPS biosynthesis